MIGIRNLVAATGIACSLALMLGARQPDATQVARKTDRDAPLARKGDYLIPSVISAPDLAARWVPLAPAVTVDGELPNESLPSLEGPSPPDPPLSAASQPVRTEATPHHRAPLRAEAMPHHQASARAEATPHHQASVRAEATPHHQAHDATSTCSMTATSDCADTCSRAACLALHAKM